MDDDALYHWVAERGLAAVPLVAKAAAWFEMVLAHAPQLRRIVVATRGMLRQGVPAGQILQEWANVAAERWGARGVDFRLVVRPRLHVRRLVLQGTLQAMEFRSEWGLAAPRECYSEVLLFRHDGQWQDPACDEVAVPCPPVVSCAEDDRRGGLDRSTSLSWLVRGVLAASRRRAWAGLVQCTRCQCRKPAGGSFARLAGGRTVPLLFGGSPAFVALRSGL